MTEQKRSSDRAQSRRDSNEPTGEGKKREKPTRSVSVLWNLAKGSKLPPAAAAPSRCSNSSRSTCQRSPLTLTMPVPGGAVQRQRAKRVPDTEAVEPRVPLLTWTPSQASDPWGTPHQELRLNFWSLVSSQLPSFPTFQPHWATA